jgi:hypothetical protein
MAEAFRDEAPGADEGIALDESGIIPDVAVPQRGGINGECRGDDQEDEKGLLFYSAD